MECCIFSTVPSGAGWICGAGGGHERFLYPMDYMRQMAEKGYICNLNSRIPKDGRKLAVLKQGKLVSLIILFYINFKKYSLIESGYYREVIEKYIATALLKP